MKKRIRILFVLVATVCGATGAFAQSESDFEVTVANGQVTITKYRGSAAAVVIPATIRGLPVVVIGNMAFLDRKDIISASIPASVTNIGDSAFSGCTGLTTINIPASVTSIGGSAFYGCTGLTSIRIGANVKLRSGFYASFENKFDSYYNTNGKMAEIYTYRNGAWSHGGFFFV